MVHPPAHMLCCSALQRQSLQPRTKDCAATTLSSPFSKDLSVQMETHIYSVASTQMGASLNRSVLLPKGNQSKVGDDPLRDIDSGFPITY